MKLEDVENHMIAHADDVSMLPPRLWCRCCRFFRHSPTHVPVLVDDVPMDRKVLVLDLDETLVHCSFYELPHFDTTVKIFVEGGQFDVYVQKRPMVEQFLNDVIQKFHVIIFTASVAEYANPVIDTICPGIPPEQRFFRDSCSNIQGMFVKDLAIFEKAMDSIIIVDNNPCSFVMQPGNAILSATWEGDMNDTELIDMILPLLNQCMDGNDVRAVIADANNK